MDAKFDWTYDPKRYGDLPSVVEDLHEHGQKYIMIIVSAVEAAVCWF